MIFGRWIHRHLCILPAFFFLCLSLSVADERRLRISKANHIQKALTITINTPVTSSQTFCSECHLLYACAFFGLNRVLKRWVAYELHTVCKRFFGGFKILHCHTIRIYFKTWMSRFLLLCSKPGSVLGPLLESLSLVIFLQILWQYLQIRPLPFHLFTVCSGICQPSIWRLTVVHETVWISYRWK